MLTLSRIEGFFWVAKMGGYARAARAFPYPITQPGVYQQVRKIELELETKLIERIGHDRVRTTPAGAALYNFVAPFFEQMPAVERSIRQRAFGGTVRILAADQLIHHLMPGWLRRVGKARPDIDIELHEGPGSVTPLLQGELDLVVDHIPGSTEGISTQHVTDVHAFIVLPKQHPACRKKKPRAADLAGLRFVAYSPDRDHHARQKQALAILGVDPRHVSYAGTAESILGMVSAGLGFPSYHRCSKPVQKPRGLGSFG